MGKITKQLIVAAVAAVPLGFAASASAQYMVGSDGRALDASNQVGSGGYNQAVGRRTTVSPDDIVYGNVTAGRHFRGSVSSFDAREFRGSTSGNFSDNFIRGTAGAPLTGTARVDLTRPQTFYGQSRAVSPPPDSAQVGSTGAFIGTSSGQRLDHSIAGLQPGTVNYARPGALILPSGAQGAVQHQSVLTGSPLYGVRELTVDDPYLADLNRQPGLRDAGFLTQEQRLRSMQQELRDLATTTDGAPDGATQQPRQGLNNALQQPFESPENAPIGQQSRQQQNLLQGSAISGDLATGESRGNRLLLPSAAQQSTQYAELQRRLERYQQQTDTATDANARAFREQQRLAQAAEQPIQPDRPAPRQPGQPGQPDRGTAVRPPTAVAPAPRQPAQAQQPIQRQPQREIVISENLPKPGEQPLQVKSLAEGIQAEGLRNIMLQAEEALQRGRFRDALVQYEQAEQVAPNNPLIELGKVNALLGSTSFARAYTTLRNAFAADPALLLAQYDLKTMYGEENLARVVKELKFVADVEKTSPEAMFLLAYVAYNSGNEEMAAQYLAAANERSGGRDKVVQLLQQYWTLPKAPANQPAEINK